MQPEDISVGKVHILHKKIARTTLGDDKKREEKKESLDAKKRKDAAESEVIKEGVQELGETDEEQSEESEIGELTYDLEEETETDQSGSEDSETDEDDIESSSSSSHILYLCESEDDEIVTVIEKEVKKQVTPGDKEVKKKETPGDKEVKKETPVDKVETKSAAKDTLQSRSGDKVETKNAARVTFKFRSVLNFAKEEFVCELNVEPKQEDDKTIVSNECHKDSSAGDLNTIDIRKVALKLLKSSCSNCSPNVTIDKKLREDIATDLNEAILRPSKKSGSEIDLIILLLVPAVAIDVKLGAIFGYGIGQLVAYGKNYSKISKIFRGYAKNVDTFQNIVKIINKTLN